MSLKNEHFNLCQTIYIASSLIIGDKMMGIFWAGFDKCGLLAKWLGRTLDGCMVSIRSVRARNPRAHHRFPRKSVPFSFRRQSDWLIVDY